jgi:hypothetical protein
MAPQFLPPYWIDFDAQEEAMAAFLPGNRIEHAPDTLAKNLLPIFFWMLSNHLVRRLQQMPSRLGQSEEPFRFRIEVSELVFRQMFEHKTNNRAGLIIGKTVNFFEIPFPFSACIRSDSQLHMDRVGNREVNSARFHFFGNCSFRAIELVFSALDLNGQRRSGISFRIRGG